MVLRPKKIFRRKFTNLGGKLGSWGLEEAKWPKRAKIVYLAYLGLPEVLIHGVYTLLVGL